MVQKSVQISGSQFLGDATLTPQKLLNLTVYFERKKNPYLSYNICKN